MLTGWDDIQAYTKHSRRTILYWAETKGFPLVVIDGVYHSSRALIDEWLKQYPGDKNGNDSDLQPMPNDRKH